MNPNYVQLNLGGKPRGFKFGIGFLEILVEELDTPLEEISGQMKKNPFKVIPQLVLLSHRYNEKRAKRETELETDDVIDWIDESGGISSPVMTEFLDAWNRSMMMGQETGEETGEGAKKEVIKKKKERPITTSPLIGTEKL